MEKKLYSCPVCGREIINIHKHYLDALERLFNKQEFPTIREGKIHVSRWHEPDLFVLTPELKLQKVVEVIVTEGYASIREKIMKIRDWLGKDSNVGIIVFEPVLFLDKHYLPDRLTHYTDKMGYIPKGYKEIEEWHKDKWRKEEGIEVTFWNEEVLEPEATPE